MGGLETLISTLGLSFASGVNLYATVLIVGLAHRFEWFNFLPEKLEILSNPVVLTVAGVLYLLEFFADKVPFISTVWDGFHTFIRPLGAAALALGAADEFGPAGQVIAMLIGGSIALGSHTTKATTRVLAHTAPEPATHSVISVAEDVGVVGLLALVYTYPYVAGGVLAVLIIGMMLVTPMLLRTLRFTVGVLGGYLLGSRSLSGDTPPEAVAEQLKKLEPGQDWVVFPAYGRDLSGVPRLGRGYLALCPQRCLFLRSGVLLSKTVELGGISELELERALICDIVQSEEGRVCIAKNWTRAFRAVQDGAPAAEGLAPAAG